MSEFKDILDQKAVALKYDEAHSRAPIIVASGMGYLSEKIVETASEHGIPIYEDNSLATLLSRLKLGTEIPEALYQTVAEIYLYFLSYVPGEQKEVAEPEPEPEGEIDGEDEAG